MLLFRIWLIICAPISALTIATDSQMGTQSLSSPGIPSDFKVEIQEDASIPIAPDDIYRAAINMMYLVSDHPLQQTWQGQAWQATSGNVVISLQPTRFGKDPSQVSTQQLIWTINHLTFSYTLHGRYCKTTAILRWKGVTIGSFTIAKSVAPTVLLSATQNLTDLDQFSFPPEDTSAQLDIERDIKVQVIYKPKLVDKNLLFLTGIRAIGDAAERGLDISIPNISTTTLRQTTWKLFRETKSTTPIFRPGHSRIAIAKTVAGMMRDRRYQEVYAIVRVDGKITALGGFSQG